MMLPLSFMRGAAELTVKKAPFRLVWTTFLEQGFVGRASRCPARDACIGEDDVKFAKVFGELSEELLAVLRHRNVGAIAARAGAEFGDRFIQRLLIPAGDGDLSAFCR